MRDLCKAYVTGEERVVVLAGLCLDLNEREMIAVTGASGSGKSTLLHLVGGMDRPDRGTIRILGMELTRMSHAETSGFRNRTIGFLFQFHHLLPEFTALENVTMPLLLRGTSQAEAGARAKVLLKDVGLEKRSRHRPGELSGGEQQRVALARALVGEPRLLLADEPTGNLDPNTADAIGMLIRSLHDKHGLASIIVTHNQKLAGICSQVYRLGNGRLNDTVQLTNDA